MLDPVHNFGRQHLRPSSALRVCRITLGDSWYNIGFGANPRYEAAAKPSGSHQQGMTFVYNFGHWYLRSPNIL